MRQPLSLTLRLTLLFGIAAAIVFPLFVWIIDRSIQHHFETEDEDELRVTATAAHRVLVSLHDTDDPLLIRQRFSDILVGHHDAALYVADSNGDILYVSSRPDLSVLARAYADNNEEVLLRKWMHDARYHSVIIQRTTGISSASNHFYTVVVSVSTDYHLRFLANFRRTLWTMSAAGILAMTLMGWLAVRQGHAPLRRIITRIRQTSASQLQTRMPPESFPAELTDLAVAFNDMLARIEDSFVRLSNFSADIAHELRTPVTNLLTQTQVALSQIRSADEYREILYSSMEEYEHMARMIGDMLFMAQADNARDIQSRTKVKLASEIMALFDYYEAWAEAHGVQLVLAGDATMSADRQMLRRAVSNLLSNAIRHSQSGKTVRVLISATDQEVVIVVENPGATIAAEHLPHLFERFYRVDSSRRRKGEGAGLGLAIAKSIIEVHGGSIAVTSADGQTRFVIRLPRDSISRS